MTSTPEAEHGSALNLPAREETPLIGLLGAKRTGKDSFARFLAEEGGFERVAYADPLKEVALAMDPIVGRPPLPSRAHPLDDVRLSQVIADIGWEAAKDYVPEVRVTCLQALGMAVRSVDPTFWIRLANERLDARTGPVVVTDVRLPNEVASIRERGGVLIRLVRPDKLKNSIGAEHETETALADYVADVTVQNDGTLEDLREQARKVLAAIYTA